MTNFVYNKPGRAIFISPSGKTAQEKRKSRASALAWLLLLTPLILGLVRDKKGIMNPESVLSRSRSM